MQVTYTPYDISAENAYAPQKYPTDYPLSIASFWENDAWTQRAIVTGTDTMSIRLSNITEFTDEPARKGTFEFAGVFQNTPLFFMRQDKGQVMTFHITCNAYSSLPIFLKYCNCWGKLTMTEKEYLEQKTVGAAFTDLGTGGAGVTRSFYVVMEPTIKEKPVVFGKTQFEIDLKFTRVQI